MSTYFINNGISFIINHTQNKVNAAQTKATNSADDSDGSDGDDEEQDANKTHDEVSIHKHQLLNCFSL